MILSELQQQIREVARDFARERLAPGAAFVLDAIVSVAVTFVTKPKPVEELQNLVYGMAAVDEDDTASEHVWYRRPDTLAAGALGLTAILSFIFA